MTPPSPRHRIVLAYTWLGFSSLNGALLAAELHRWGSFALGCVVFALALGCALHAIDDPSIPDP